MTETLGQALTAYDAWLERQPLAAKNRNAYRLQVRQYGAYKNNSSEEESDGLLAAS